MDILLVHIFVNVCISEGQIPCSVCVWERVFLVFLKTVLQNIAIDFHLSHLFPMWNLLKRLRKFSCTLLCCTFTLWQHCVHMKHLTPKEHHCCNFKSFLIPPYDVHSIRISPHFWALPCRMATAIVQVATKELSCNDPPPRYLLFHLDMLLEWNLRYFYNLPHLPPNKTLWESFFFPLLKNGPLNGLSEREKICEIPKGCDLCNRDFSDYF